MLEGDTIQKLTAGDERPAAVVVAVQLPGVTDGELASSVAELERLAKTLGLAPVGRVIQRRSRLAPGVVLGAGKLVELAGWTGGSGVVEAYQKPGAKKRDDDDDDDDAEDDDDDDHDADAGDTPPARRAKVVIVDHDLTPTQQHNLERATGVDVLDRTSVILEIFHRHAKTREARLQVESRACATSRRGCASSAAAAIASAAASAARARARARSSSTGAASATASPSCKRRARADRGRLADPARAPQRAAHGRPRRLHERRQVVADARAHRRATSSSPTSCSRRSTRRCARCVPRDRAAVLVVATRSASSRSCRTIWSRRSDRRSTRPPTRDLLLHVVDASDPAHADQLAVTREVLREIGADDAPSLAVAQQDRSRRADARVALADHYPQAIQLSAKAPGDVAALRERLVEYFGGAIEEALFEVPWAQQRLVHAIHERTTVLGEDHGEDGTRMRCERRRTCSPRSATSYPRRRRSRRELAALRDELSAATPITA